MAFQDISYTVSNSFGERTIESNVSQARTDVQTAANSTIDNVDAILNQLKNEGTSALNSAKSAIQALDKFKPSDIDVDYIAPTFTRSTFSYPDALSSSSTIPVTYPADLSITTSIDKVSPPAISGTAPDIKDIDPPKDVDKQDTGGKPAQYNPDTVDIPKAPGYKDPLDLVLDKLTDPPFRDFTTPVFEYIDLEEYQSSSTLGEPPDPVEINAPLLDEVLGKFETFTFLFDHITKAGYFADVAIRVNDYNTIGSSLVFREVFQAEKALQGRGFTIRDEVIQAQKDYLADASALMNTTELTRFEADRAFVDEKFSRTKYTKDVEYRQMVREHDLFKMNKVFDMYEYDTLMQRKVFESGAALYNATVATYIMEAELYKVSNSKIVYDLEKFKAEIELQVAITKANASLGENYEAMVDALVTKAQVYEAEVKALIKRVEGYGKRMEAVKVESDIAKTAIQVFGGKVDAYVASLEEYKADFQAYEGKSKGTIAKNQMETVKTQVSEAKMKVKGAEADKNIIEMTVDAENIKAQLIKQTTDYENRKLENVLEGLKAQIQADKGKMKIFDWSAKAQLKGLENEAIATAAQNAVRFYDTATNSIYRAAEQAFKAIMVSTEAAATAQQSAARSGASVAQGAYSAVHVTAALQGGGRVSATDGNSAKIIRSITDMLNDTEERVQVLSA